MSEFTYQHKDQITFDSLFDDLTEDDSQEEAPKQNIRFIKQKRQNFPIQLTADFNQFMEIVERQPLQLTEKGYISSIHLFAMDERMNIKAFNGTNQTKQENFPYIHFFYHIALAGKLMELHSTHTEKLQLKITNRLRLYYDLTDTEQYLFLLETFWVDVDWAKLLQKDFNPVHHMLADVLEKITNAKSKSHLDFAEKEPLLGHLISDWNYFFLYMQWFGFWICEKDQEKSDQNEQGFFVKKLTATPFGLRMIPILLKTRDIAVWNIPLRCEFGESSPVPGSKPPEEEKSRNANSFKVEPFFQVFRFLFPENDLHRTLPRNV